MLDGKERQYRLQRLYGEGRLELKEVREEATLVRALARKGMDIQVQVADVRKAELYRITTEAAHAKTLQDLFDELVKTVDRKGGGAEVLRSFKRDVFSVVGDLELKNVYPERIEQKLRGMVERGSLRSSVTISADIKQMFRWAARKRKCKLLFENPTDKLLSAPPHCQDSIGANRLSAIWQDFSTIACCKSYELGQQCLTTTTAANTPSRFRLSLIGFRQLE